MSLKKERTNKVIKLHSQLRAKGGVDYVEFVKSLLNPNDKVPDISTIKEYEIKHFSSLKVLTDCLKRKEKKHGLCRLVAGYAWPWQSKNNKQLFDIKIEGEEFQWNSTNADWINSKYAHREIGCIHTTQGYDLNYVGVIFGPEITYSKELNEITIIKENYHDRNGKVNIRNPEVLKDYIINIYKTLLLRGIKGTYIYVCDESLRNYLKTYIPLS